MMIIPSIDIKGGKCVKLVRGRLESGITIANDPIKVAKRWEDEGADALHVVDLDGSMKGKRSNWPIIANLIREVKIPVQVGGGLRTYEDIVEVLQSGARWAIIGTVAVENPEFVIKVSKQVGSHRLIVAVDSINGRVAKGGWTEVSSIRTADLIKKFEGYVEAFLYTDIEVEGTGLGIRWNILKELLSMTSSPIIYAGGIATIEDLVKLAKLGIRAAVIGSALYKGSFTLQEAKEAVERAIC